MVGGQGEGALSPDIRIGQGYDVHRFALMRPLVLGGVTIPHERGLEGHSDADVLIHALMDALLGACGLPDIGILFPNTDPAWAGANSRNLLRQVMARLHQLGWAVGNADCTLIAEEPRIAPHVAAMRKNLSEDLGISGDRVGIKATTNERIGFVGRREGIAALAVVLLVRKASGEET
jgi:2-C-methyl-D-erythritol 2,4-cyclodiphosphate synthase